MKCNPLRWLWGLLPLAVWTWIAVLGEHERVETDLKTRTEEALADAGLSWAKTTFSGRDGILSGRALEDNEPQSALQTSMNVHGVRIVDPQTDLIRMVDNYLWSAAIRDNATIVLNGYVPNEKTRKAIVGVVKANFPKSIIQDRMELARGVPSRDVWLGGVGFALKQLAGLKTGHAQLAGLDVSLDGQAEDLATYKSVKSALRSRLPSGIKLASDKVRAPVVDPFAWAAQRSEGKLVLSGFVPSDQARDEIVAHAKAVFSSGAVADRMEPAEGAPQGFVKAAKAVIDQLALLRSGDARMKARHIDVTGNAEDEATAGRLRKDLKAHLPDGFKIADAIDYPKPPPPDNSAQIAAEKADAEARRKAEEETRLKAEQDVAVARRKAEEAARLKAEQDEAASRRKSEDAARLKAEQDEAAARRKAEDEARRKAEQEAAAARRKSEEAARLKAEQDAAAARHKAEEESRLKAERDAAAAQRKAEADKCQTAMREVARTGVIRFERASADLDRASHQTLKHLAQAANACPRLNIEIEGHTDAEGTPERNQKLSDRRAKAVSDYLVEAGVDANRLSPVGYGETRPVAPNDTAENRAKNRRIEFSVKSE